MRRFGLLSMIALAALLLSCGKEEAPQGGDSAENMTLDPASPTFGIYQTLRAMGFSDVTATGTVSHPFFPVEGTRFSVIGRDMETFEFESKEEADKAAASISPDGMTIDGKPAGWKASPHFFRSDKVLVVYIGDEPEMKASIERALGRQFAGK